MIGWTLLKTTFCVHRFFFYSFTASDGSEGTTAGCVVSLRSIMVHHGFRSKEVRHAIKLSITPTSHSSLLVASQGDVSCKLNQALLLLDTFNFFGVNAQMYNATCRANWPIYIYNFFQKQNVSKVILLKQIFQTCIKRKL